MLKYADETGNGYTASFAAAAIFQNILWQHPRNWG